MTCHPSCSKNNALQWRWHWHLSNCSPMDSHVPVVGWYLLLHYWIRHHCLWDTFPPFRVRSALVTNCLFVCLSANSNWKELVRNISWPYIFTLWKPKFLLPFGIRRLRSLAGLFPMSICVILTEKRLVQKISWPYIFTLWKPKFLLPFGIRRLRSLAGLLSNVQM